MLPNKTRLIRSTLLSACLVALPLAAYADLTITNTTSENSTSVINNGVCSILLDSGVTKANSVNVVSQRTLDLACYFHKNDCKADIFMNPPPAAGQKDTCNGYPIATVIFSTTSGVIKIVPNDKAPNPKKYKVTGSGFALTIS